MSDRCIEVGRVAPDDGDLRRGRGRDPERPTLEGGHLVDRSKGETVETVLLSRMTYRPESKGPFFFIPRERN